MNYSAGQILILEDEPSWQSIYMDITSEMGYSCRIVDNAPDALRKLVQGFYHVVIVDLSLVKDDPRNLDGMKVLKLMRRMNEGTQGVVSTGYAFPKSIRDAFKEGEAFDLIEKGEDTKSDIDTVIRNAVSTAKKHMNAYSVSPSALIKGLNSESLERHIGIQRNQFERILDTIVYLSGELLDNKSDIVEHDEFLSLAESPRLYQHSKPIRFLDKNKVAVIVYWSRNLENAILIRISTRQQVKQECEFFVAHPEEAQKLGLMRVSRPFYAGNYGGLIYVVEENEILFSEFDHPWFDLFNEV
jgi:CheY-like chemotaxis protein